MTTLFKELEPAGTAIFSPCGRYRYRLGRHWGDGDRLCNFLMLNPSTADADTPDPTITRCINFAKAWGYDGLTVTNLFALRSTDPKVMLADPDPIGRENDRHILNVASGADLIVCAWGNDGAFLDRGAAVLAMLHEAGFRPHCLRMTKEGHPWHPLYLPKSLTPTPMEGTL
jgi:hypothetical protein